MKETPPGRRVQRVNRMTRITRKPSTQKKQLSWKPIRRGEIYCSSACGGNCKWADYQRARSTSSRIAKQLGTGWDPVVSENLGWHWSVIKGVLSVHPSSAKQFWASVDLHWSGSGPSPQLAIVAAVRNAAKELPLLRAIVELIEEYIL